MFVMTHHITYSEVAPLRHAAEARKFFIDNFDVFLTIAIVIYRSDLGKINNSGEAKERDRLAVLSAAISSYPGGREWMNVLQRAGGDDLLERCSRIVAGILLGHEREFDGTRYENLTLNKSVAVRAFRDSVRMEFDL